MTLSCPSSLPRNSGLPAIRAAGRSGAPRLSGRRILLAEDEALLALELEMMLSDAGAEMVGPVMRLGEGMRLPSSDLTALDAAILDVDLRGEDVFPLAERLRALGVPFLFHTAHGERAALQARFAGVSVCTKPTHTERLVEELARLVEFKGRG